MAYTGVSFRGRELEEVYSLTAGGESTSAVGACCVVFEFLAFLLEGSLELGSASVKTRFARAILAV